MFVENFPASQLIFNINTTKPVMTMQYLCGELDALELGVCFRQGWLALKGLCRKIRNSDFFQNFGNGQMYFIPDCCPASVTPFCPRKLLADIFIVCGTLGPNPINYYQFWSKDDLEYRGYLISYGGFEKRILKSELGRSY